MNIVDASCSKCGAPTYYDGTLPILCASCRTAMRAVAEREKLGHWFNEPIRLSSQNGNNGHKPKKTRTQVHTVPDSA